MRTILFFIVLSITFQSYSQDYIPFPVDNAKWGTEWRCQDSNVEEMYSYTSFGDTIINNSSYCRLKVKFGEFYLGQSSEWTISTSSPAFYREENKKIYLYDEYYQEEILGYDFNLNVNDTFVFRLHDSLLVVEEVEYFGRKGLRLQTINNLYLGAYWSVVWIQGIGSLSGIMHPIGDYSCSRDLICFYHDDFYPIDCDRFYEVMNVKESVFNNLKIFPNPVTTELNIISSNEYISSIKVYSVVNGLVLSEIFPINYNKIKLDISHIEKGMYILTIQSNKGIITKKFVKN